MLAYAATQRRSTIIVALAISFKHLISPGLPIRVGMQNLPRDTFCQS
jgi:hypothetical protein